MDLFSTLTIAGNPIDLGANRLILNSLTVNVDRPDEFEFTELDANLPGSWQPEQTVTLALGNTVIFNGWIFSRHPASAGVGSITVGYRCMSLKYGAYQVPITAADGTGIMAFNLPVTDPNYVATQAGLDVGQILTELFNIDAPALNPLGIFADGTTTNQLSTLLVVPPDPVYLQGPSLWSQVDQLLQQWYGSRYGLVVTGAGLIRLVDTYSLGTALLTFGTDPITMPSLSEDTSECYTQVVVRGRDIVIPAVASLSNGDLIDPNTAIEPTWNLNNFLYPIGGWDEGSISLVTSTQVTINSDDPTQHVAANYWSGLQAQIACIDPVSTLVTGYEYKHITANTAMVAGGSCVITLDSALGGTSYTRYQIRGANVGQSECYCRYEFANTYVAQHLVEYFPYAVNFGNNQFFTEQTNYPISVISINNSGLPWQFSLPFQVIPYDGTTNGHVLFYAPIVQQFNSQSNLIAGGSAVIQPTDVSVFVPYSAGTLNVTSPMGGGYSGTAFSRFNVQRTLYRDYANWIDQRNTTAMQALGDAILATTSQALIEGQITYYGQRLDFLVPGAPLALNLAHFSRLTSYENMDAPCRSVTLEWPQNGAVEWITRISFSTRRQAYSGDRLYLHANYTQGGGWFSGLGGFAGLSFGGLSSAAQSGSVNPGDFSAGNLGSSPAQLEAPGYAAENFAEQAQSNPLSGAYNPLANGPQMPGPPDPTDFAGFGE